MASALRRQPRPSGEKPTCGVHAMGKSDPLICGRSLMIAMFALPLLLAGTALALPCKGESVYPGDPREEVAANCGEATLKEERVVTVEESDEEGTRRLVT